MAEATITSKGQVTIPKSVRDALNLKSKDKIVFVPLGDHAVMRPLKGNVLDLRGSVKHKGGPIDFRKLRADMESEIAKDAVNEMGNKYAPRRR
ncbi:AbrB family transcriptional regulator [Candidatus Desantisbacteria bacterium CG_4_10_14_0_8_um_filter_48_22]|uniref:AbrB family transcriptional regulator n=1 Tax=Candidatus Desantisbacteria bacterium CG_4_10_14_0_8_um_filter_48_22 TaxID=1974543 RepID=A0A2M7SDA9_9BACT|nr:MAG: hypothetical protein AUJ67_00325 [Candidatus Desantisbacteria bacterium CG1_02_49_89]PIV56130.1 MAG: AbrB family transcriptional regulator [Candidatus Desantisbacteria bacterium CG02_land_8_20_14_3_00_49_13]PIZ17498.1 MAG: AbrB family transcriptional regulator [Candidatus Desantisbacteria bacterium CG_4_10_14_0_8_um_filter_48_22]